MINYFTQVAICWGLFYLLYALWLKKETFFNINRWYLLSTLIAGLLIPAMEFQIASTSTEVLLNPANYLETITVTAQAIETNLAEIVITPINENWNIKFILLCIYWSGVLFFASRFLFGVFQIIRLAYNAQITRKSNYFLVKTNSIHLPFSFMDYLFWSDKVTFDKEDHEKILIHELSHIKGKHSIDVLITELLSIALWCVPFVFLYKNALKNIHEYLADNAVLKDTPTKKYGQLLLRQSTSGFQIAQANNLIHSQLKKRILMMTKIKSQRHSLLKYLAILPLALVLVFSISAKNNFPNSQNSDQAINSTLKDSIPPQAIATEGMEEVFKVVEEMPRFIGCEDLPEAERKACANKKMLEYVYTSIKYPAAARNSNIQGVVVASFIVEKDGSISNTKILREIGGGCEEEVLRVTSSMPDFIPGKQSGKNVRVQYHLPVKFKLEGPTTKSSIVTKEGEIIPTPPSPPAPPTPPTPPSPPTPIDCYKVVEEMPLFPGTSNQATSKKELISFVYTNLKYPKIAANSAIQGTAVVNFVISKEGKVINPKIVRSIGGGTDEEILRVVDLMNALPQNWTPGKQRGKNVNVEYNLPVKFKLEDDHKSEVKSSDAKIVDQNKLDKESFISKINVYPNPSAGKVTIDTDLIAGNKKPTTLTITDLNGKQLYKKVFNEDFIKIADFELNNVPNGLIFISFEQDGKVVTKEVVLQK